MEYPAAPGVGVVIVCLVIIDNIVPDQPFAVLPRINTTPIFRSIIFNSIVFYGWIAGLGAGLTVSSRPPLQGRPSTGACLFPGRFDGVILASLPRAFTPVWRR